MKLSDTIRSRLAAEIGPCPTFGHPRQTISGLAVALGQPASSVGRYLAGGKPSVALLDAASAYLEGLAAPLTQDEARDFLAGTA